jgi:hypothetical protein
MFEREMLCKMKYYIDSYGIIKHQDNPINAICLASLNICLLPLNIPHPILFIEKLLIWNFCMLLFTVNGRELSFYPQQYHHHHY